MHLTTQQLATTLAALRYWQQDIEANEDPPISEHFADEQPLTSEEIDALCERINTSDPEINGGLTLGHPFTSGQWTAERDMNGELALWDEHDNNLLHSESDLPREEREANAALMARAPVMHHALRMIAGISAMEVLNSNAEPDAMAANLEQISNALGEIQGLVRKAIVRTPSPNSKSCTCHLKSKVTGPVPHHCNLHDGDYMTFLAMNNCD